MATTAKLKSDFKECIRVVEKHCDGEVVEGIHAYVRHLEARIAEQPAPTFVTNPDTPGQIKLPAVDDSNAV